MLKGLTMGSVPTVLYEFCTAAAFVIINSGLAAATTADLHRGQVYPLSLSLSLHGPLSSTSSLLLVPGGLIPDQFRRRGARAAGEERAVGAGRACAARQRCAVLPGGTAGPGTAGPVFTPVCTVYSHCLLYTSDAADE